MGQKPSILGGKFNAKLPLSLVLKRDHTQNPNPEQPIKFQYKTRRKKGQGGGGGGNFFVEEQKFATATNQNSSNKSQSNFTRSTNGNDVRCKIIKTQSAPIRTKSEPSLVGEKCKEKHRHSRSRKSSSNRIKNENRIQQFGYEIQDVDAFLSKVSLIKSLYTTCPQIDRIFFIKNAHNKSFRLALNH